MRSGKTLSGFRATLLSLCRLRSPAWATWVLSVPHTSDSCTFWQELNPTFQTCCYGQILPPHSLRFIAHGTLPIHRATPGAGFVQPSSRSPQSPKSEITLWAAETYSTLGSRLCGVIPRPD